MKQFIKIEDENQIILQLTTAKLFFFPGKIQQFYPDLRYMQMQNMWDFPSDAFPLFEEWEISKRVEDSEAFSLPFLMTLDCQITVHDQSNDMHWRSNLQYKLETNLTNHSLPQKDLVLKATICKYYLIWVCLMDITEISEIARAFHSVKRQINTGVAAIPDAKSMFCTVFF